MMINILLLGQKRHTQQLADVLLQSDEYTVVEADSSMEARRLCEAFPNSFDLVVTDIDAPDVHGLEFLAELRGLNSPAAIVVMTRSKNRVVEAVRFGIAGYLIRPFPQHRFTDVIRRALVSDHRIRSMVNAAQPFTVHPSIQRISLPSAS